jgi:RNA polymerase sigma-70 factor (ECF subfamily)
VWLELPDAGNRAGRLSQHTWNRTRAAERRALIDELYRREMPPLRQYVRRVLRGSSDADDIAQEAFVRLWRALEVSEIRNPRAVLFKTARNLALNHIRNGRVRNSDAARAGADDSLNRQIKTAEEEMIASEEAAACRVLMEALPLRCREAFVLRVVDELSYKEMAKEMHLSVSTIEKHIGKGKQLCRERLANAELEPDSALAALRTRSPAEHYAIAAE